MRAKGAGKLLHFERWFNLTDCHFTPGYEQAQIGLLGC